MRLGRTAGTAKDARRLAALLGCALLVAAFLAVRAYAALAGQRAAAIRQLQDEVQFAAFTLASHAGRDVYWGLVDLFAPVVPHDQVQRGSPDPALSAVVADPCEYEFTCVIELKDEDYGSRGYTARDLEGNYWSFGTYIPGGEWA